MMYLVTAFIFIVLQAFFSGIETGLVSMRKSRVKLGVKEKQRRAVILDFFVEHPGIMLATTLVGTNISVVLAATMIKDSTEYFGFNKPWHMLVVTSLLTIVFLAAEIIPKDWFRQAPYHRCMLYAYPLYVSYLILYIPVRIMAAFTAYTTKLFSGKKDDTASHLMREDFRLLLHESETAGIIDSEAADILDRSLEFHELHAYDIFHPRQEVDDIESNLSVSEAVEFCRTNKRSRLPVRAPRGDKKHWQGIFTLYDAVFALPEDEWETTSVRECLRPAVSVSELADMEQILMQAKRSGSPMLIVHDRENKEHIGIVTSKDVMNALFG